MYRVDVFYQDCHISTHFTDYFTARRYGVQCVDYGAESSHMLKEECGAYDVIECIAYTIEEGADEIGTEWN